MELECLDDACLPVRGVPVRVWTSCLNVVVSAWMKVSGLEMGFGASGRV